MLLRDLLKSGAKLLRREGWNSGYSIKVGDKDFLSAKGDTLNATQTQGIGVTDVIADDWIELKATSSLDKLVDGEIFIHDQKSYFRLNGKYYSAVVFSFKEDATFLVSKGEA